MMVMLLPSPYPVYSTINILVFQTFAFLAFASHLRAMFTDPVSVLFCFLLFERMTVRDEVRRVKWVVVLPYFKIILQKLPGKTVGNCGRITGLHAENLSLDLLNMKH
jgi:hypothetical protein